jgi:capsular polysaccharide biosynthesis protein
MKRAMKLLARLYPSGWRERYGAEFEALVEDAKPSARDAMDVLWGALKMQLTTWTLTRIIVAFSILGMIIAAAVSFVLPKHFISRSSLLVEPADESALLRANRVIQQSAFDRETLASIIQECNLYSRDHGRMSEDALIDKMTRNIRVVPGPAGSSRNGNIAIFDVHFDYPDPNVAQRVNAKLLGRLILGNLYPEKSNLIFRVLDPPILAKMPADPGPVRSACFGLLAGFLVGLLIVGLIKWRTATSTRN